MRRITSFKEIAQILSEKRSKVYARELYQSEVKEVLSIDKVNYLGEKNWFFSFVREPGVFYRATDCRFFVDDEPQKSLVDLTGLSHHVISEFVCKGEQIVARCKLEGILKDFEVFKMELFVGDYEAMFFFRGKSDIVWYDAEKFSFFLRRNFLA